MDAAGYVALTRQSGLMREMGVVANNIANISTTGFRREGVVFSEHVARLRDEPSLSMAAGRARMTDLSPAGLTATGGSFDLAIEGEGFFRLSTAEGERLTRAGHFTPSPEGELMTPDGHLLLDAGGAPIFIPAASAVSISADGTISANGEALTQIQLWRPSDPLALRHQSGTLFDGGVIEPLEAGVLRQGYLEDSNVNAVTEVARMIEVQRAYELGQKFLDAEDGRARSVIQTLGAAR